MRFRKTKLALVALASLTLLGAGTATAASAAPAGATPGVSQGANAPQLLPASAQSALNAKAGASPATASSWYTIFVVSQRNTQCARGTTATHLAAIDSYTCTSNDEWDCRVLNTYNGWLWNQPGEDVECVDPSLSFMFGESGGAWKMETIDSSQFITDTASFGNSSPGNLNWQKMSYYSAGGYFASGPSGSALGMETSESTGYGWYFCGDDTCGGTVN